jgi:hypothetical protein
MRAEYDSCRLELRRGGKSYFPARLIEERRLKRSQGSTGPSHPEGQLAAVNARSPDAARLPGSAGAMPQQWYVVTPPSVMITVAQAYAVVQ